METPTPIPRQEVPLMTTHLAPRPRHPRGAAAPGPAAALPPVAPRPGARFPRSRATESGKTI